MTFAYIHEFQTCFSQSSCLPSFPSFLYLSFISYLIGFNLLFKESTLSFLIYIYIYIYLYLDRIHHFNFYIYLSLDTFIILHFFLIPLKYHPFFWSKFFDGLQWNFWYLENFNLNIPKIPILERIESRLKKECTRASLDVSKQTFKVEIFWKFYIILINHDLFPYTASFLSSL